MNQVSHSVKEYTIKRFIKNLPVYCLEAWGLGTFMISAVFFTILLEHPASSLNALIPSVFLRRTISGVMMGLTAIAIIYSPWGKRSGAHMNPAFTIAFYMMKKISLFDAAFYILFQFLGGLLGVVIFDLIALGYVTDIHVNHAITTPQNMPYGVPLAFIMELLISFGLMWMVLFTNSNEKLTRYTGIFAGIMIFLYITFEAPFSGMSMNPARTVASALPAMEWNGIWIYFIAPLAGMLLAVELFFLGKKNHEKNVCAKFINTNCNQCIFLNCQCMTNNERN